MTRFYPAIEIHWPAAATESDRELMLAALDDHTPTAVEDLDDGLRVFFTTAEGRDRAAATVATAAGVRGVSIDVSDENWAERSQASLEPVRAGRLVIVPREDLRTAVDSDRDDLIIVIRPSMGFGTGHHASTRLCLRLLQHEQVAGASVLDVGTGSGILAIAARKLGAATVVATDIDGDALQSAGENVELNGERANIDLQAIDLAAASSQIGRTFSVVLANLTAAAIVRHAAALSAMTAPAGCLIASGIQPHEFEEAADALARDALTLASRLDEGDWVGAVFRKSSPPTSPTHSTAR